MPFPIAAAIIAGAQLLGGAMSGYQQSQMNAQQMRFMVEMYNRQRQDALADWNMQNEYNSPVQQMRRFKNAGLNPNLIYGQGSAGLSQPVRSSSPASPNLKAPTALAESIPSAIMSFQDAQIKQQQYDNLKKQSDLLETENLLKLATIPKITAETGNKEFDLGMKQQLQQNTLDVAEQKLRNMQFELSSGQIKLRAMLDRNESEIAKNSQSIAESLERITTYRWKNAKTKQEIENLKATKSYIEQNTKNGALKYELMQYEKKLNDMGLRRESPEYMTIIANLWRMLYDRANTRQQQTEPEIDPYDVNF